MKTMRTYLHATLALLLALSSIPAWACARTCSPATGSSLVCVKLCARSQALLTQDGKLDSLGAQACGIQTQAAPTAFSIAAFELPQPDGAHAALVTEVQVILPLAGAAVQAGRAPPSAPDFLSSYHPQANAPPSFC